MEYIINLLKECIVASFLFAVLWMLTPRFIKSMIRTSFKITKVIGKFIGIQSIKIGKKGFSAYKDLYSENKKNDSKKKKNPSVKTKVTQKAVGDNSESNVINFPVKK